MRQQASGIRGSAGPSRTLSQRAIDRVRRVLAARRQHTENAELAAAIKFTQGGKRCSTPLRTEARLDRRVPGALWQAPCTDWFETCYRRTQATWKGHVGILSASPRGVSDTPVFRKQGGCI